MRWMLLAASVSALGMAACDSGTTTTRSVEVSKDGTTTTRTVEVKIGDAARQATGAPGTEGHPIVSADADQVPTQVIKAIYARKSRPSGAAELNRFFTSDLAAALIADESGDGVGAINSDYRYDAQDTDIAGLELVLGGDPGTATVEATFTNFGEPGRVFWILCPVTPTQWKVQDVEIGLRNANDLRAMLDLPPTQDCK